MKTTKLILAATAAALLFSSCEKDEPAPALAILTFEDQDYKGESYSLNYCNKTISTWSDLICEEEYDDPMLYKYNEQEHYNWYDQGNTFLAGGSYAVKYTSEEYGTSEYWSYGHAVSNYVTHSLENIDYLKQLSIFNENEQVKAAGHNGSKNFCIHFGYRTYPEGPVPALEFGDGKARVIDHMWVNNTAYTLNALLNGDGMTGDFGENDWFKIVATGFNGENKTGEVEFFLGKGKQIIKDWTRWNLSGLGEITKVSFDLQSSKKNDWGMTTPAYFAYDDVAVRLK